MPKNYFPGHNQISMTKVVNAYVRRTEGKRSGETNKCYV